MYFSCRLSSCRSVALQSLPPLETCCSHPGNQWLSRVHGGNSGGDGGGERESSASLSLFLSPTSLHGTRSVEEVVALFIPLGPSGLPSHELLHHHVQSTTTLATPVKASSSTRKDRCYCVGSRGQSWDFQATATISSIHWAKRSPPMPPSRTFFLRPSSWILSLHCFLLRFSCGAKLIFFPSYSISRVGFIGALKLGPPPYVDLRRDTHTHIRLQGVQQHPPFVVNEERGYIKTGLVYRTLGDKG